MKVVSVISRKGGASKTTLAVNLASALFRRMPTVLVDADDQRSAAKWLKQSEVPVIAAETPQKIASALKQSGDGIIVCDGPPYSEAINRALYQAADLVIVPVRPSALDIDAAAPILKSLASASKPMGLVVLTQVDARSNIQDDALGVLQQYGVPVSETFMTRRIDHARAVLARKSVIDYRPSSLATFEVNEIADEVCRILGV